MKENRFYKTKQQEPIKQEDSILLAVMDATLYIEKLKKEL